MHCMQRNQTVSEIDIGFINVGKVGMEAIANVVEHNDWLKSLSICQEERIKAEYMDILVEALKKNKKTWNIYVWIIFHGILVQFVFLLMQ